MESRIVEAAQEWTPARVRAAAADWVWVPDGAPEVKTDEYHLVAYPEGAEHPTQVAWCRSERPVDELMREVAELVRGWGRERVGWWVSTETQPGDLESRLRDAGAVQKVAADVMAFDMNTELPEVGGVGGVRCVVADDEAMLEEAYAVVRDVWGAAARTEKLFQMELAELSRPLRERETFRVLAYVGDEPAATAACTRAGAIARLWGGATRAEMRGGGAYRAVLQTRLAVARDCGATLGLVKANGETSGPILRRIGFGYYGELRLYDLPL